LVLVEQKAFRKISMNKKKVGIVAVLFLIIIFGIAEFYPLFTFGANIYSFFVILGIVALVLLLDGITRVDDSETK
jgi:TM2 domain-containing membrane protein YozV